MTQNLKIRKIGGSLGVLLPKELLAELGVGCGATPFPIAVRGARNFTFPIEFAIKWRTLFR